MEDMSPLDPRGQLPSAREHRTATRLLVAGLVSASLVLSMTAIPSVAEEVAPPVEAPQIESPQIESPPVQAPTAPPPMPTSIGSWCTALFPMSVKKQRTEAQLLMNGTVDLGKGGTYTLSQRPNWRPQASADLSGNRHIHSLDWALPLLYRGVNTQNQNMVNRFRELMYQWIDDHASGRGYWIDGSIYGGLRTQTLACAAQTLGDPKIQQAAVRDAASMWRSYRRSKDIAIGANNTDLVRQTGALATFCYVGDVDLRNAAWRNLVAIARGVIHEDGSDVEGSPHYAMYMEKLLSQIEVSASTCGIPADPIPQLRGQLYSFVSQAVRPDFKLESLGDTVSVPLRNTFGVGDWRADWLRSRGAVGTPPTPTYTAYSGGYIFGRYSWVPSGQGQPDTFYSLRFKGERPATAHTHDDGGSLTLFSRGVEWIGDPGPFRYNSSALRSFVKKREAHSTFTVSNTGYSRWKGVVKTQGRTDSNVGGNDYSCLVDKAWNKTEITRCVTYVRSADALIVADYINGAKVKVPKKQRKNYAPRKVTQRWQLSPGVGVEGNADGQLTMVSGEHKVDIVQAGVGTWDIATAREGSSIGWHTTDWGVKAPGAVLSRSTTLPRRGGQEVMITVFVPRGAAESAPVVIGESSVTVTRNGTPITVGFPAPN
jgi:Heparinase II/III-like protein